MRSLCLAVISIMLSSISVAEVRCQNLFDKNFLPLSMKTEALKITDLLDKTSIRIRGVSEFKRIYQDNYFEFATNFYAGMNEGNAGLNFLNKVKIENPQLQELVYHPGIVTRQEIFFKFISTAHQLTAAQALNQFTKHLGSKIWYRALSLPDQEVAHLKSKNLLSGGLNRTLLTESPYEFKNYNLKRDIMNQFSASFGVLPLSVTRFPEVALAVAQSVQRSRLQPLNKVFLFSLELPTIDTLELPFHFQNTITILKNQVRVVSNIKYGPDIESFVLFGINEYEIKEIEKIVDQENSIYEFDFH